MPIFRTTSSRIELLPAASTDPRLRHLFYAIGMLLLVFVQVALVPLIAIGAAIPNLPLILCVMIALREGQMAGLLYGFIAGLLYDFAALQILGVDALAWMLAAFAAGYFYSESSIDLNLTRPRFFGIVLLAALIQNLIAALFVLHPSNLLAAGDFAIELGGNVLYTVGMAVFPWMIVARRYDR